MTANEFDLYVTTPTSDGTYTNGYDVETGLASAMLANFGGEDYFDVPVCAEDGTTAGLWYCQMY